MSFSEIERLPYFKYEWIISDINEIQKKMEEEHKANERNNRSQSYKMPSYSMPKVNIPKF